MAEVRNLRRFYLLKRRAADDRDEEDFGEIWRGKQEEQPATALPADFFLGAKLAELGYTAREDLDGADEAELVGLGLSAREAQAVLNAWAALPSEVEPPSGEPGQLAFNDQAHSALIATL